MKLGTAILILSLIVAAFSAHSNPNEYQVVAVKKCIPFCSLGSDYEITAINSKHVLVRAVGDYPIHAGDLLYLDENGRLSNVYIIMSETR